MAIGIRGLIDFSLGQQLVSLVIELARHAVGVCRGLRCSYGLTFAPRKLGARLVQGRLQLVGHVLRRLESQRLLERGDGLGVSLFRLEKPGKAQIGGVKMRIGVDGSFVLALGSPKLSVALQDHAQRVVRSGKLRRVPGQTL